MTQMSGSPRIDELRVRAAETLRRAFEPQGSLPPAEAPAFPTDGR